MSESDFERLLEALAICVVEVPGQSVHHAFGRVKDAKRSGRVLTFGEDVNDFLSDRNRAGREFNPVEIFWMNPMAILFNEAERRHGSVGASYYASGDGIDIVGFVRVFRVNRYGRGTRKNHGDAVCSESSRTIVAIASSDELESIVIARLPLEYG